MVILASLHHKLHQETPYILICICINKLKLKEVPIPTAYLAFTGLLRAQKTKTQFVSGTRPTPSLINHWKAVTKRSSPTFGLLSPRTRKTNKDTWGQSVFVLDIVFHWNFCNVCYASSPIEYILDSQNGLFSPLLSASFSLFLPPFFLSISLSSSLYFSFCLYFALFSFSLPSSCTNPKLSTLCVSFFIVFFFHQITAGLIS